MQQRGGRPKPALLPPLLPRLPMLQPTPETDFLEALCLTRTICELCVPDHLCLWSRTEGNNFKRPHLSYDSLCPDSRCFLSSRKQEPGEKASCRWSPLVPSHGLSRPLLTQGLFYTWVWGKWET